MDTTILKGFALLEKLAESDQPRGVSELSRQMQLTKSNVQRVLSTLVELGYAQKDPTTGRYQSTLKMWEFGYKALSRDRVRWAALPYLRDLFERCGETIFLCIGDGLDIVYIDKVEVNDPLRVFCMVGTRMPAWRTAAGRAILAFQPEDLIEQALDDPHVDGAALKIKLAEVRKDGYAISLGEFRSGVNSVAAPIWSSESKPVGSVVINGQAEKLPMERMRALAIDLKNSAMRISEALGFSYD